MIDRYGKYKLDNAVCWQYKVKEEQNDYDKREFSISAEEIQSIRTSDLTFDYVGKEDISGCREITKFIERYEWLAKMPVWVTHRFTVRYKGILVGVVVMATPYTIADYLKKPEYKKTEKLIARGATNSIAPKNTASWIISNSMDWMVKNTEFRIFSAYADPEALELGTVYQSCNFYYTGQTYGGGYVYIDPDNIDGGWFGDSYFRQRSVIKKAAVRAGVPWNDSYIVENKTGSKRIINWTAMSGDIKIMVEAAVKEYQNRFTKYKTAKKHKYVYVLGKDKRETRMLRSLFEANNKLHDYPIVRGK